VNKSALAPEGFALLVPQETSQTARLTVFILKELQVITTSESKKSTIINFSTLFRKKLCRQI
jgi:hypothetical protein